MAGPKNYLSKIPPTRLAQDMAEACFSMLDMSLDSAISVLNEKLEYQYLSKAMYAQLGLTADDLKIGDTLQKCHDLLIKKGFLTPELIARNRLSPPSQLQRDGNTVFTSVMELADGRKMKLNRTTLDNGYTVSVSHDVSEYVEKDVLLEDALALGRSGYWTLDLKTKETKLSKTLEDLCSEETLEAIKTQGIRAMVLPEDHHILPEALKKAMAGNGRFKYSTRTKNKYGKVRRGLTVGEILRGKDGKPARIRAFVKDITKDHEKSQALEKAKDEAISASVAKSEFLANMSHEIRTPMNGILGMAELLGNSNIDGRQKDYVKVINNSAKALLTIINDILDFSKIEAGALELDPVPFDLHDAIHDVGALLHRAASEKSIELLINYAPDTPKHFIGDAGRIRQILNNLLSNAVKFTDSGQIKIDVSVTPARNDLNIIKIDVTDTGIGIAPEKLKDVFQKFTQADGSTTRLYGGTGLGLSITKCITELMNGRIKVQSKLGEGSTFTVAIPLPTDLNAKTETYDTATLSKRRILVVDDVAVNRHILSEQLRAWDVEPVVAVDAAEALKILTSKTDNPLFDMVLLDYLMPDQDGLALAKTITEHSEIAPVPLVMLTSFDPPLNREGMADHGILDCLTKPIREQRLYERLTQHFTDEKTSEVPESHDEQSENPAAKKIDILVAEDFKLNQDVVRLMLSESKYCPVFADNGQIAVDFFKAEPDRFAAILMDISMPVKDGYQAAKDILAFEAETGLEHTSIIALTGHALKHDREKCLRMGMDEYLSKPVKQAALIEMLDKRVNPESAAQKVA